MNSTLPQPSPQGEPLLTPGEVAAIFRVDPKTVTRWASTGRLRSVRTPGGHRRFKESEVKKLLAEDQDELSIIPVFPLRRPEGAC